MNKRKGITLIALVITIVIMLILTAIGLSLAFGNDGLYKKAKLARETQMQKESEDKLRLTVSEIYADIIEKEGRPANKGDIKESETFKNKFEVNRRKIKDKQTGKEIDEELLDAILFGSGTTTIDGITFNNDETVFKIKVLKPDTEIYFGRVNGLNNNDITNNGTEISIDYGDGTTEEYIYEKREKPRRKKRAVSLTTSMDFSHVYAKEGEYIIRIKKHPGVFIGVEHVNLRDENIVLYNLGLPMLKRIDWRF